MKLTPVIRRNAILPFKSLFDEFESMINEDSYSPNKIVLDIIENSDNYEIHADLPGFKKEDITIEAENNQLTIAVKNETETEAKSKNYIRRERKSGYFKRVLSLGNDIDTQSIKANLVDGILKIFLSKREKSLPKKIEVN